MFAVFRSRSFTMLWSGQLISGMGSALTTLAASILVYRITNSALSVGLMLMATAGPTILVGLLAGVYVDRGDRKKIMVASDILRCVLILLIPVLAPINIVWLYVLVALSSAVTQFFESAHASVLPELASDEELASANSLMAISSVGSTTVGFAVAGFLALADNIEVAFLANSATFALSAILVASTRIPSQPVSADTSLGAIGRNLKAGLQTVLDISILRSLFVIVVPVFALFGFQNTLLLPFAIQALGASEFEFGLQQAAEAVGVAVGSLAMARLGDRLREGQWLVLSYVLMGIASMAYAVSTRIPVAILLVGVSGLVNAPSFIGRQLVIQRSTPREMRGRVNSTFFVVRDFMFVVGMAMAGLGDILSLRLLFFISSLALFAMGAVGLVMPGLGQPAAEWKRTLRRLRGEEAAPRMGPGEPATLAQIERFIAHRPELQSLSAKERQQLTAKTLVATVPPGKVIVYFGEASDAAYFILSGSVGVGIRKGEDYVNLNTLREGDFFGEVAALTGRTRTADVISEEPCELLVVPARVLRDLTERSVDLKRMFYATMTERLRITDLPLGAGLDQGLLRELRTEGARAAGSKEP